MIRYDYGCHYCGFLQEVEQSFSDKPLKHCPKCDHDTFERLMSGGAHAFVKGEATTLGQLAERNSKKMGKEQVAKKTEEKKQALKDAGIGSPDTGRRKLKEKLTKGGDAAITRYIEHGD